MAGIPYRIKKKTRIRSGKKITTNLYLGDDKIESQNTSDTLEQLSVSSLYGKKKIFFKRKNYPQIATLQEDSGITTT